MKEYLWSLFQVCPQLPWTSPSPRQRSVSSDCADEQCFFADLAGGLRQQHRAGLLSVASSHRPINYHHCAQISGGAAPWWPWSDLCRPLSGSSRAAIQSVVKSCQTGSLEAVCGCVALAGEGPRWIDFFIYFFVNLCLACKISRARCEINISCATLSSPLDFLCPGCKWTPLSPLPPRLVTWLMLL